MGAAHFRLTLLLCASVAGGAACRRTAVATDPGALYLRDSAFRHSALVASLVNPENEYSRLRLASYAVAGRWDALPVWNPRVEVLRDDALGFERPLSAPAVPLSIPPAAALDRPAL